MKTPDKNTSLRIDALHKAIDTTTDPAELRRLRAQLQKLERNIK